MKKILLITLASLTFSTYAQPTIQWQKSLGGTGAEVPSSIHQTSDGGFIVAGYTSSNNGDVSGNHGNNDYWIVKLDATGNIQWQKCFGGTSTDAANSIQQTTDGGYIISGFTGSNDGNVTGLHGIYGDYWIVKLDDSGNMQWQKCLGGTDSDMGWSAIQTNDGGYIVAGKVQSNDGDVSGHHLANEYDYWIVKLNSTGTIQWQKCLGGTLADEAYTILQTNDGGYIVAGQSVSNDGDLTGHNGANNYDYWIVKLDVAGTIQWQKSLGGTHNEEIILEAIQQTTDGGYIVAGATSSNDGDVTGQHNSGTNDYWIVKLNSIGNIQWQKCLGGSGDEEPHSIQQTSDGGYIVAGSSESNDGDLTLNQGNRDLWIVKLNVSGSIQWQKSMGGSDYDYANSIQQTTDGGYIIAGASRSTDGDVIGNHGNYDYWIVKLSSYVGINEFSVSEDILHFYPNPIVSSSILQFDSDVKDAIVIIYNILGKEIIIKKITGNRMEVEKGDLESGVYFLKVRYNEREYMKKIVVE